MSAPSQTAASQQAAAQTGLTILAGDAARAAVPNLDINNIHATAPDFTRFIQYLISKYGAASATLAARYYRQARIDAGLGAISVNPADPASFEGVQSMVEWALSSLHDVEPDVAAFERRIELGIGKLVQDVGRATILDTVHQDRKARGWARIPEPAESHSGTCAFCAMLSARGATYKTERSADFKAHDGCNCHPEPVFNAYEPTAQIREWQALWSQSTKGMSGRNARAAFRQAIEGRPVTGLTRGSGVVKPKTVEKASPEVARRLISQLESANQRAEGNPRLDRMVAANTARIDALRAA